MSDARAKVPGIKAKHLEIRPACRANRGVGGAFAEAVRLIREEYMALQLPVNEQAIFHLVLTVDRPEC